MASAAVAVAFATGGTGGGAMTRTAPGSNTWEIDVVVPPNNNDVAVTHSVQVTATDTAGSSQSADGPAIAQDAVDTSDQAPTIEVTDVSPAFLEAGGGQVRIQATAHDDHAISQVYAVVSGPGGSTLNVSMTLFSPSDYEGTVDIPANTVPTAVSWTVVGHVRDDQDQEGTDQGTSIVQDANVAEVEEVAITDVVVDPSGVAAEGGTVEVSATITSEAGIEGAGVQVSLQSGGQVNAALTPAGAGSDSYSGEVAIPANPSTEPASHSFEIQALGNDDGSASSSARSSRRGSRSSTTRRPWRSSRSTRPSCPPRAATC